MQLKNSKGQTFQVEDKAFAHGGEGDVYKVTSTSLYADCCVKIFHEGKMKGRESKLSYMIAHQLAAPVNSAYRICWPIDYVYKGNQCVGFVMPKAFDNSHTLYEINLKDGSPIFQRSTERGMLNRMKLLYNIANAIAILHSYGYVLADFKPQNILFTDNGRISLIDMDSIQIVSNGQLKFGSTAATLEYAYPKELHLLADKKPLTPAWDVYSFTIVAYQILLGIHPFTASTNSKSRLGGSISTQDQMMANNLFPFGPRSKEILACPPLHYHYYQLHDDIQAIILKALDLNVAMPTMVDWRNVLKDTIQSGNVSPNMFKANPKVPIFVVTSKIPDKVNSGQKISLSWKAFNCDSVSIHAVEDYEYRLSGATTELVVPFSRTISISLNGKYGKKETKIVFSQESLFCTQCGNKFSRAEDLYCTICGTKRV